MAGLLDPKSRVVDAVLTSTGRAQAFAGGLKIRYVTFSDGGAKYQGDSEGVAIHSSASLGFEAFSNVWDSLTAETDDRGQLLSFSGDNQTITPGGKLIVSGAIVPSKDITSYYVSSSLQSLENLQIIASADTSANDSGLSATPTSHVFSVSDDIPFSGEPHISSVDDVESLFADKRLANLPNFKFLPPVQRSQAAGVRNVPLGTFQDLSETDKSSGFDPMSSLDSLEGVSFEFSTFTEKHTVVMQAFEEMSGSIKKLEVIPYGAVGFSPEGGRSYMYFAGKVYDDGFGTPTYVNVFTLVVE
jgi:hypothetical protein